MLPAGSEVEWVGLVFFAGGGDISVSEGMSSENTRKHYRKLNSTALKMKYTTRCGRVGKT